MGANRKIDIRDDGSLFIRQVGPSNIGEYTCTVTSSIGAESVGGFLNIIGLYIQSGIRYNKYYL